MAGGGDCAAPAGGGDNVIGGQLVRFSTAPESLETQPPIGVYPLLFRVLQVVGDTVQMPLGPELMVLMMVFVEPVLLTTQSTLN
jgi:hypothetical protein